ncbi:hypothetical protein AcV7_004187 [Taiwanofungus camphoratus]|nr:hypothetical protein AcV7_004187 [Antrodia cinnamomea]
MTLKESREWKKGLLAIREARLKMKRLLIETTTKTSFEPKVPRPTIEELEDEGDGEIINTMSPVLPTMETLRQMAHQPSTLLATKLKDLTDKVALKQAMKTIDDDELVIAFIEGDSWITTYEWGSHPAYRDTPLTETKHPLDRAYKHLNNGDAYYSTPTPTGFDLAKLKGYSTS